MRKVFALLVLLIIVIAANSLKAQIAWPLNGTSIYYNGGNVGIGTNTPAAPLHVFSPSGDVAYFQSGTGSTNFKITQETLNSRAGMKIGTVGASEDLRFTAGSTDAKMVLLHTTGNVGIGTLSPTERLTISNANIGADMMSLQGLSGTRFIFSSSWNGVADYLGIRNSNLSAPSFVLDWNGNVGIGTTAPLTKLHIEGASANWNETTPGGALGTIHLSTGNTSDHFGNAITWGASDAGGAQAGIYTRSDGTYGTKMYFATTDSYATGSKTRLFIDADGKVGIGTTTPTRKLHVGIATSYTNADPDADIFSSGGIIVNGRVSYDNSYYVHAYQCFQGATGEKGFLSYGYYGHEFKTRQGSAMVIRGDNNYVGIGTTAPQSILHVHNQNYGTGRITLSTGAANAETYSIGQGVMGTSNGGFSILDATNNITRLAIQYSTGNVGIGTTNPQYKLAVKGTIGCGEVKVEDITTWADFVFHPSYKLRTLGEVEQFIKTNSHLPEIPTEAEVKDNGINVGEMNAKLLQKVEELTLYMIEMKKENDKQKKENEDLKKRVEILENK